MFCFWIVILSFLFWPPAQCNSHSNPLSSPSKNSSQKLSIQKNITLSTNSSSQFSSIGVFSKQDFSTNNGIRQHSSFNDANSGNTSPKKRLLSGGFGGNEACPDVPNNMALGGGVMEMCIKLPNGKCKPDWAVLGWKMKELIGSAATGIPYAGGGIKGLFDLVQPPDEKKRCLAELNRKIDRNLREIKKAIRQSTEEIKDAIKTVGKEALAQTVYVSYFELVANKIYDYEIQIPFILRPEVTKANVDKFNKTCRDGESTIYKIVLSFSNILKNQCHKTFGAQQLTPSQTHVHGNTSASENLLHRPKRKELAKNKTFAVDDVCLPRKLYSVLKDNDFALQEAMYSFMLQSSTLLTISMVCDIVSWNTSVPDSETFSFLSTLITETTDAAQSILLVKWENQIEGMKHFICTALQNTFQKHKEKIKSTFWIYDHPDITAEVQNLAGTIKRAGIYMLIVENSTTLADYICPKTHCFVVQHFLGLHIIGGYPRTFSTRELRSQLEKQYTKYEWASDDKGRAIRFFGYNASSIVNRYKQLYPHEGNTGEFVGWFIFYKYLPENQHDIRSLLNWGSYIDEVAPAVYTFSGGHTETDSGNKWLVVIDVYMFG